MQSQQSLFEGGRHRSEHRRGKVKTKADRFEDKYTVGLEGGGRDCESRNTENVALTGEKGKKWIFPRASGGNTALCSRWFQRSGTHSWLLTSRLQQHDVFAFKPPSPWLSVPATVGNFSNTVGPDFFSLRFLSPYSINEEGVLQSPTVTTWSVPWPFCFHFAFCILYLCYYVLLLNRLFPRHAGSLFMSSNFLCSDTYLDHQQHSHSGVLVMRVFMSYCRPPFSFWTCGFICQVDFL